MNTCSVDALAVSSTDGGEPDHMVVPGTAPESVPLCPHNKPTQKSLTDHASGQKQSHCTGIRRSPNMQDGLTIPPTVSRRSGKGLTSVADNECWETCSGVERVTSYQVCLNAGRVGRRIAGDQTHHRATLRTLHV
jgi:hypothetical protein